GGALLEPRLVRAPAVEQRDRREDDQQVLLRCACRAGQAAEPLRDPGDEPHTLRGRIGVHAAVLYGVAPKVVEAPAAAVSLMQGPPPGLQVVLEAARSTGGLEQHVPGFAGVWENRVPHPLL